VKVLAVLAADTYASTRDFGLFGGGKTSLVINVTQPQSMPGLVPPSANAVCHTNATLMSSTASATGLPTPLIAGLGGNSHRSSSTLQRRPCPPPPPPSYAPSSVALPPTAGIYHPVHLQTASRTSHQMLHETPYGTAATGTARIPPPASSFQTTSVIGWPAVESATSAVTVNEFPRENIRFVEKIGEGLFGEVGCLRTRSLRICIIDLSEWGLLFVQYSMW
jgi:hypothetical protein